MSASHLRGFLRRYPIVANAMLALIIGAPFLVIGPFVLRTEISHHWFNASTAPVVNWPVTTATMFVLNFFIVWRNRGDERRGSAGKWVIKSIFHFGVTQAMYQTMIVLIGWPYLTVSLSMYALGPISFGVDRYWTFAHSRNLKMAVR